MVNSVWGSIAADSLSNISSGYADLQQGKAQNYINKKLAKAKIRESGKEAQNVRDKGVQVLGTARTEQAASGIRTDVGSAVEAQNYIARQAERDTQQVLLKGNQDASTLSYEGKAAESAGRASMTDSVMKSIMSGYGKYKENKTVGTGGGTTTQAEKDAKAKGKNRTQPLWWGSNGN